MYSKEEAMIFLPHETNPKLMYELGWTGAGIRVETHADNLQQIQEYTQAEAGDLQKRLQLADFTSANPGAWGFGEALQPRPTQYPKGLAWECALPKIDWRNSEILFNHSTTFDLLFRALHGAETPLDASRHQRIIIYGMLPSREGMCGGSIDVSVTPVFREWIAKQTIETLDSVPAAMDAAAQLMDSLRHPSPFRNWQIYLTEPHWFGLRDVGTGLYPDFRLLHNGNYQLVTHNSGSPQKQLEIFAGIAALDQLAGKDV
jgi:hypothetical protein